MIPIENSRRWLAQRRDPPILTGLLLLWLLILSTVVFSGALLGLALHLLEISSVYSQLLPGLGGWHYAAVCAAAGLSEAICIAWFQRATGYV